jgi:hypothetical protein
MMIMIICWSQLEEKMEEWCNPMKLKAKVYARVCILVINTPRGCDHIYDR